MENKYISLELSKKLVENGCKLESKAGYTTRFWGIKESEKEKFYGFTDYPKHALYPAYDILWEICVKYAEQFFGWEPLTNEMMKEPFAEKAFIAHPQYILGLLQEEQKQLAEEYIWENCLFHPKNKQRKEYEK